MTSKFSSVTSTNVKPSICKPGPLIPIKVTVVPPGVLPPLAPAWIVAYATWHDWDWDGGLYLDESFKIYLQAGPPNWKGNTFPPYPYLGVHVQFVRIPSVWKVTLSALRSSDDFEHHTWYEVEAQQTDPFILLPTPLITIPHDDEQKVEIYG